jgi:antitoxin component of RelBE/YafQ-DinJ toxin-antitoxin module
MPKTTKQTFDHLSPEERAVVGAPDDYDWAGATSIAQSARPSVTQFSLRVDRALLRQLQAIAHARGMTVSEVARESLERYVRAGGRPAIANIQVSFKPDSGLLVQVKGGRAELAANRRTASVDERVSAGALAPTTY